MCLSLFGLMAMADRHSHTGDNSPCDLRLEICLATQDQLNIKIENVSSGKMVLNNSDCKLALLVVENGINHQAAHLGYGAFNLQSEVVEIDIHEAKSINIDLTQIVFGPVNPGPTYGGIIFMQSWEEIKNLKCDKNLYVFIDNLREDDSWQNLHVKELLISGIISNTINIDRYHPLYNPLGRLWSTSE